MSIPRIVLSPASKRCIATGSVIMRVALFLTLCVGVITVNAEARSDAGASGSATSTVRSATTSSATANLILLDVEGTDVSWNPSQRKLYVAVPSAASAYGSTITVVDPIAGTVAGEHQLSSAASGLAISGDSKYLYAVTSGGSTIERFLLPALTPDIQWSLGTDPMSGDPNLAADIKVQPNASHTLAVSLGQYGLGTIAVFDDAVERSATAGGDYNPLGNSLQWKPDGSELYASNTACSDAPYTYGGGSNRPLYTMPVSHQGLGVVTTYDSTFREGGCHLQSDPKTGYVYGDWGEVVNAATGIPIGNYRWNRPTGTIFPGPLSVVDPSLGRVYTLLEVEEPNGTLAFRIQEFDQTKFQLLHTIVIPSAVGYPANFIRWGRAGLAFVTSGFGGVDGKLYILDGGFVNPSAVPDTTVGAALKPVPTLTAISPLTANLGSGAVTLTVNGSDFIGQPVVYWNGKSLPTTRVNSTELSAQIPASHLAAVSQAQITASNTATAEPASNSLPFSVNPPPPSGNEISVYSTGGNDLVWDAKTARIYVSTPGVQGDSGDAIAIIDPVAGKVASSPFVGSDPAKLSISDNGQYLYVALYGANAIKQLALPSFKVNASWNLGGVGSFDGPYYALDVQAAPGSSQTTAVVLANFDISPAPMAVAIYDASTPRPNQLPVTQYPYSSLQWTGSASTLYAVDQQEPKDFLVLGVTSSGAILDQHYDGLLSQYSPNIQYDAGIGLVYTDGGQAIQPSNGTVAGTYGASGIAVPDSTLDRVFILGQTAAQVGTSNYTIESFNQTKFTPISSITIKNVVGAPTALIRWGSNGLAFTTRVGMPIDFTGIGPGQLYVISGDFVASSSADRQSSRAVPQLPVQRTWSRQTIHNNHSRLFVVNSNPLMN